MGRVSDKEALMSDNFSSCEKLALLYPELFYNNKCIVVYLRKSGLSKYFMVGIPYLSSRPFFADHRYFLFRTFRRIEIDRFTCNEEVSEKIIEMLATEKSRFDCLSDASSVEFDDICDVSDETAIKVAEKLGVLNFNILSNSRSGFSWEIHNVKTGKRHVKNYSRSKKINSGFWLLMAKVILFRMNIPFCVSGFNEHISIASCLKRLHGSTFDETYKKLIMENL